MIINSNIFNDYDFFLINKKYLFIEDLWMSYILKTKYNYKIASCTEFNSKVLVDESEKCDSVSLYKNVRPLKNEFLDYLRKKGWNV